LKRRFPDHSILSASSFQFSGAASIVIGPYSISSSPSPSPSSGRLFSGKLYPLHFTSPLEECRSRATQGPRLGRRIRRVCKAGGLLLAPELCELWRRCGGEAVERHHEYCRLLSDLHPYVLSNDGIQLLHLNSSLLIKLVKVSHRKSSQNVKCLERHTCDYKHHDHEPCMLQSDLHASSEFKIFDQISQSLP
ncbi:hypothetical protein BAE44_0025015, partial [Dichanthelium oligosanthes]